MSLCPICQTPLIEGHCPFCPQELFQTIQGTAPNVFPRAALPPPGVVNSGVVRALATALVQNRYEEADGQWATIAAGLRPLGPEGRRQTADCLEAWARLKLRRGLTAEAERLFQRAVSARKDPQTMRQRPAAVPDAEARPGWDNEAWKRLQPEADKSDKTAALEKVRRELDEQLASDSRQSAAFKISGLALVLALVCSLTGHPIYIGGLIGAAVGWVWSRFG